jgi:putative membrane protein
MHFAWRLIINAVAVLAAAMIVPGIHLQAASRNATQHDWVTLAAVALIFGVVNVIIRPILLVLTLPLTIVTLGLFTFVVNALMLLLTSWVAHGLHIAFRVDGFVPAFLGALIITVVSFVLSRLATSR